MGWLDAFASTMSGRPSLGEGSGSGLPADQQHQRWWPRGGVVQGRDDLGAVLLTAQQHRPPCA